MQDKNIKETAGQLANTRLLCYNAITSARQSSRRVFRHKLMNSWGTGDERVIVLYIAHKEPRHDLSPRRDPILQIGRLKNTY